MKYRIILLLGGAVLTCACAKGSADDDDDDEKSAKPPFASNGSATITGALTDCIRVLPRTPADSSSASRSGRGRQSA